MEEEEIGKMVVVMNNDDATSVMAALVMSAAIASSGEQVLVFVQDFADQFVLDVTLGVFHDLTHVDVVDRILVVVKLELAAY